VSGDLDIVPGMVTLGLILTPDLEPAQFIPVARAADDAGLEELWVWEDCFKESGVASAAAVLGATSRVRVGLGVLPVPLRNVALTAMELATLEGMFPGRLVPGVGHGVQDWMGQVGARVESPLTLLREHVDALRALLSGERVTVRGRYVALDDVRLDWPPASAPPLLAAGEGPKTLRLVGEVADGVVLTGATTLDGARRAVELTGEGREVAGRSGPFQVVKFLRLPDGARAAGAEATAEALRPWAEAGVTTLALIASGNDLAKAAAWLASEVAPLLA
jgi:alkanesulfonate monooxygenase SsuD/methylene tetrahydromethanopterin reductase-like flavin-dependent oxidoreductase (luciferase family)